MVSNKFLGALAVKLELHKHLKYFSSPLQSQIMNYAEEVQAAEAESDGVVDYWATTNDPPKVRSLLALIRRKSVTDRTAVSVGYGGVLSRSDLC